MVRPTLLPLVILVTLLGISPWAAAEDGLEVRVPPVTTPLVPTRLVLVAAAGAIASVQLPQVAGITLAVAPDAEQREVLAAASTDAQRSLVIDLTVAAAGDYVIPAIVATLSDGSSAPSRPQTLRCRPDSGRGQSSAWAQVRFDPAQVVVGERTRLIYLLALRADVAAYESAIAPPSEALRLETEPRQHAHRERDPDGRAWVVHQLVWVLDFAHAGSFQAGGVQDLLERDEDQHGRLTVEPATVVVSALPAGAPADYQGQIGAVALRATLAASAITADQGTVLEVALTGDPDALVITPRLDLPPGLHAYAHRDADRLSEAQREEMAGSTPPGAGGPHPSTTDQLGADGGVHRFRWDLVPADSGTQVITVPGVPFYDPASRSFGRSDAVTLTLTVLPGRPQLPSALDAASPPGALALGPQHLHGPGPDLVVLLALAGFALCLALGVAPALRRRRRRPENRARHQLLQALSQGEAEAAAQALALLRQGAPGDALARLDQLAGTIDLARFGHRPLDPAALTLANSLPESW